MDERKPNDSIDRHVWQITALRDVFWIVLSLATLWLIYRLQAVVVPVIVAFVLAYLVEPIVDFIQRRLKISRTRVAVLIVILVASAIIGLVIWLAPILFQQVLTLLSRLPVYVQEVEHAFPQFKKYIPALLDGTPTSQSVDNVRSLVREMFGVIGRMFGIIGTVFGVVTYLITAGALTLLFFGYFVWYFPSMPGFAEYLPKSQRDEWTDLIHKVEAAFAGFFRGQLVVALFTAAVYTIGFWIIDIPYWGICGLVGGIMALVPYGQAAGPALAILLKYLEVQTGDAQFDWFAVVLYPAIVYGVMQIMETFIVTPWVQSSSTNLHPILVFAALVGGGSIGGLVGMFLAIPLAATAKILLRDVFLPKWRKWASDN